MKGTSHKILSLILALVLVLSMFAAVVAPASAAITAGTVFLVPNPTTAGAVATWTVTFTTATPMVAGDTITVVFPSGVVVPTTIAKTSIQVGTAAAPTTALVDASVNGQTVIVSAAGAIAAGASTVIFSQLAGIKNPNTTTTAKKGSVETSKDPGAVSDAVGFTPTRLVTFTPTSGASAVAVTVTGVGFTANSSIDLAAAGGVTGSGVTDATGAFTIVGSANAAAVVTATDGAGLATASTAAFVLTSKITVSPVSGIVSTLITVTGSGFPGAVAIGVPTVGGVALTTACASEAALLTAAKDAYWIKRDSNDVTTPKKPIVEIQLVANTSSGAKTISITEGASTATGTFTVDSRVITLSPATGPASTTVNITGTGFSSFVPAVGSAITFNAVALVPAATFATAGDGTMSASIVVPAGTAAGTYAIKATDGEGNSGSANFVIPAALPATVAVSPVTGPIGTSVKVTGANFKALSSVTAQFTTPVPVQTTIVGNGSTDSAGGCVVTMLVPASAAGFATVTITDAAGTAQTATFTVTATVAVVTVKDALSTVSTNVAKVWTYDAPSQSWKLYDNAAAAVSDLTSMTKGQGYWMQSAANCTLTYGVTTYSLIKGWNLIGWLG